MPPLLSLPVRGAWIEILLPILIYHNFLSLPVRGAWIEIQPSSLLVDKCAVAPRAGSVD